jgi:hypothetical protein
MDILHHSGQASVLMTSASDAFWLSHYRLETALLVLRIAALLILAIVLWNCAPWLERLLLPKPEAPEQSA